MLVLVIFKKFICIIIFFNNLITKYICLYHYKTIK